MLIQFPYNEGAVEAIKELPNRRWVPDEKAWDVPDDLAPVAAAKLEPFFPDIADALRMHGASVSTEARRNMSNAKSREDVHDLNSQRVIEKVQDQLDLPLELFPYQEVGVSFIELAKGRALLGDEMGLGKTAQSLAWLTLHPEKKPVIVVCPASMKVTWEREIQKWIPGEDVQVIKDGKDKFIENKNIYIINYDLMKKRRDELLNLKAEVVILDECTYIKEGKSQRTKATVAVAKESPHIIALSGTPILNKPIEFYNVLHLLNPKSFKSQGKFGQQFCAAFHDGYGWKFSGVTNSDTLNFMLKSLMIRREKREVLTELPDKRREYIYLGMPNAILRTHDHAENGLRDAVRKYKASGLSASVRSERRMLAITALNHLRQVVGTAKAEQTLEIVKPTLEANKKIVIFGHYQVTLDGIEESLKKAGYGYVRIDGKVSGANRQEHIDTFQSDSECQVMLASIMTMGMGVNLTEASDVFIVDRSWTPAVEEQGEDRLWRIGQKNDVTVWYLVAENTVDDKMTDLIERKRRIISQIVDGKLPDEKSIMEEMFSMYNHKKK